MPSNKNAVAREMLRRLQNNRCFHCGVEMTDALPPRRRSDPRYPPTMCTLDHLFDRADPRRRARPHPREGSKVAACLKCNMDRCFATVERIKRFGVGRLAAKRMVASADRAE